MANNPRDLVLGGRGGSCQMESYRPQRGLRTIPGFRPQELFSGAGQLGIHNRRR